MTGDGLVLDGHGRPLDQIRLTGISATGYHGVFDHERREGQTFVADVVVHLDTRRAAASDDLERTVDYGALAQGVAAVLSGEPADLVETVAERIAATVLAASRAVEAVDVAVHKPQAPLTVPFDDVVVAIRRDRSKLPAAEPVAAPVRALEAVPADEVVPAPAAAAAHSPRPVAAAAVEGDELDRAPAEPVRVVLALGSNVGASQATLRDAVLDLRAVDGLTIDTVSPLARTVPVGGPEQGDYLNAVVLGTSTLAPRALLRATQAVELAHGRERAERWGPRTLDIDLIVYGSVLAVTDDLELPHPRAHERAFVLEPWSQADPDAVLPGLGGGPVAALAATAPDRDGIRWLALDWLDHPAPGPSDAEAAHGSAGEPADEVVDGELVEADTDADADADADAEPLAPALPAEVVDARVVEPTPVAVERTPVGLAGAGAVPAVAPDADEPFEEIVLDPIDEPVVPSGDDVSETRRLEPVAFQDEEGGAGAAPEPPPVPVVAPAPAPAPPPAPSPAPTPAHTPSPAPVAAPYAGAPYRSAAVEGQPRPTVPPVPTVPAVPTVPPATPVPSAPLDGGTPQPPAPQAPWSPPAPPASPWSPPVPAATPIRPAAPGAAAPLTPPVTAPTAPSAPTAAPAGPPVEPAPAAPPAQARPAAPGPQPTAVQPVVPPTVPAPERDDDQLAWLQEDDPRPRPDGTIGWPRRPDAG